MTRNVVHMLHVLRGDHISVLFSPVSLIFLPLNHCLALYVNNVTLNSLGNTTGRQCLLAVQSCIRFIQPHPEPLGPREGAAGIELPLRYAASGTCSM